MSNAQDHQKNSIISWLGEPMLSGVSRQARRRLAAARFDRYLCIDCDARWYDVLYRFAAEEPWSYWETTSVELMLELLGRDEARTKQELERHTQDVDKAVDNLLTPARVTSLEKPLSTNNFDDLLLLSSEILPEYLRRSEHIFGNMVPLFYSLTRTRNKRNKRDLKGICDELARGNQEYLTNGYDDKIRNAIAHGEVRFTNLGLRFGDTYTLDLASFEFLHTYDEIQRTTNSMLVAILLFTVRSNPRFERVEDMKMPRGLATLIMSGVFSYNWWTLLSTMDSEFIGNTEQKVLHAAVSTPFRNNTTLVLESCRLGYGMQMLGLDREYKKLMVSIHNGYHVPSLLTIDLAMLADLVSQNSTYHEIPKTIVKESTMLWVNESDFRNKWRSRFILLKEGIRQVGEAVKLEWEKKGYRWGARRFAIKKVENASAGGVPRLRVTAVLRFSEDADDVAKLVRIVSEVVRTSKRKRINPYEVDFRPRRSVNRRPRYVWVHLYRQNGTHRWLSSCGWGNGLLQAEYIARRRGNPIQVRFADFVFQRIRFKFAPLYITPPE